MRKLNFILDVVHKPYNQESSFNAEKKLTTHFVSIIHRQKVTLTAVQRVKVLKYSFRKMYIWIDVLSCN